MGTRERRDRERLETREKILAAARELFAREGYEAVTMRAIAEHVEYTPTAIYHHFANKQALVTELCALDFEALARHFVQVAEIEDPVERVRRVGEAYLEFSISHPYHYRFMFMTQLPDFEYSPEYVAEHIGNPQRDAYALLRITCEQMIARGRLRAEFTNPDEVAQMLWAGLHGLISLRITKGHERYVDWFDLRQIASDTMDALFRGILKDPATMPESRHAKPRGKARVGSK